MNIAIIHPYPVHAQAPGGVTRLHALARHLARRHQVSVFTHAGESGPIRSDLEATGVRHRSFPRSRPGPVRRARWWLDASAPYWVHYNVNPRLADAVAAADRHQPFDVVHLELGYMAPALAGVSRHAIRVLAEQEAMPLMLARLATLPWWRRTPYEHLAARLVERAHAFDRRVLPGFDLLYGITGRERDYLSAASGRQAGVLPHVVDCRRFEHLAPGGAGDRILFLGNFAHRPNLHALHWFITAIWPAVRVRRPDAYLAVAGSGLTSEIRTQLTGPSIIWLGYVEELPACYGAAAVVVNPVTTGGGMRGKLLEAFASGAAVVTTSVGIEGVDAKADVPCLVADAAGDFAEAVCAYLADPARRRQDGAAARLLTARRYDVGVVFGALERDYEWMVHRRPVRRSHA